MQSKITLGIVGGGFVGNATSHFQSTYTDIKIYDTNPGLCTPEGIDMKSLMTCDLIMICVPTPKNPLTGECVTDIVTSVISQIKSLQVYHPPIVIRSTVPPGTSNKLGVSFFPEFLCEKTAIQDFCNTKKWILGTSNHKVFNLINNIILNAPNVKNKELVIVQPTVAEMIKYSRNCFLATKIAFCNEIYNLCQQLDINDSIVLELMGEDDRIGKSHIQVPGHDGKFGFGGKCLPKDLSALLYTFKQNNLKAPLLQGVLENNLQVRADDE